VKRYASLGEQIRSAIGAYAEEIRTGVYPAPEHCYSMREGEQERIATWLRANPSE
jgi:3-methyl-2-oxobutanoate hydroxymethyltransferase